MVPLFYRGAAQNINKVGTISPIFRRLTMSKSGSSATLNTDASITTNATFTSGVLLTTATNFLNFADNATSTGDQTQVTLMGLFAKRVTMPLTSRPVMEDFSDQLNFGTEQYSSLLYG